MQQKREGLFIRALFNTPWPGSFGAVLSALNESVLRSRLCFLPAVLAHFLSHFLSFVIFINSRDPVLGKWLGDASVDGSLLPVYISNILCGIFIFLSSAQDRNPGRHPELFQVTVASIAAGHKMK